MFNMLYSKYGKLKVCIGLVCILTLFNIIILIANYQLKTQFTIDGEKFKYVSNTEEEFLFRDHEDNEITVTLKNQRDLPFSIAEVVRISYKGKTIISDASESFQKGIVMTLSDESQYIEPLIPALINGEEQFAHKPFDVQLIHHIEEVSSFVRHNQSGLTLLLSMPFNLLGVVFWIYPEKIWQLQHALSVSGGEPTDWAIKSNKAAGILFIGLSFIYPIVILRDL